MQVGPGSHATGRRREGSRPLAADPVVHVPILGTRPDLRRDGGRGVDDHAAPFRCLRERVDVEQVGPPRLASDGSNGRVPGFRPREADRHITAGHELAYDASAEDSRRPRDEDAHPAGMTIK